jgi:hypothetical protein
VLWIGRFILFLALDLKIVYYQGLFCSHIYILWGSTPEEVEMIVYVNIVFG